MLRSFRFRLSLLFGLLALAAVAALAYPFGRMLSAEVLRDRGDALQAIAQGTALMLADGVRERAREVQLLAESREARRIGLDPDGWNDEIARLKIGRPYYAWIGVADAAGIVRAASGGLLLGQTVTKRPWFENGLQRDYVGDVHQAKLLAGLLPAPADGEPLRFIDFAAPLRDADGKVAGVLGVHADWRWAQQVIDQLRSDDARDAGVRVYIVDSEGRTLHHPAGADAADAIAPGEAATAVPALRRWTDGLAYLTARATLPAPETGLGWNVVVRQPATQALQGVHQAQQAVAVAGAAAALLAVLLAWLAAGHVARPLQTISIAAERIASGEPGTGIPLSRASSELERLSLSLSRMTLRLMAREHDLRHANDALEARVAERTAALAKANAHLESLAHRDGLSCLHNRRSADTLLAQALGHHRRYQRPLGVLMCDIDHFKRINDSFGHAVGDRVIQAVARCLQPLLRESDIAARFGGEEFLVILPETDAAGVARVGEKVRASIAALEVDGVGRFTVSVGGAVARWDADDASSVLRRADEALYAAKHDGRNRFVLAKPTAAPGDSALQVRTDRQPTMMA